MYTGVAMASFTALSKTCNVLSCSPFQRYRSTLNLLQNIRRQETAMTMRPIGHRHLYTPSSMGVDSYVQNREKTSVMFGKNVKSKFQERMKEVAQAENENMIFTEDLKNAVHMAEPTEDDIALVLEMAKKFNSQHSGLRFGAYIFGPVVMRMFYHLNQPDAAYQALKMKELDGFFDQISSYQLALDLLFENEKYEEVLEVFHNLQEKRLTGSKYPKNCLTIAVGACYKQNTEESYSAMMGLLQGTEEYGAVATVRSLAFAAALALKQNYPHICLELVSRSTSQTNVIVRNLKVMSLTELGRVEDALPILRSVLQFDRPDTHIPREGSKLLLEAIQKVEGAVKETGNKEILLEFQRVSKSLQDHNFISQKTLDDVLCQEIDFQSPGFPRNQDRAMLAASFNRNSRNQRPQQGYNQRRRPGLMDME